MTTRWTLTIFAASAALAILAPEANATPAPAHAAERTETGFIRMPDGHRLKFERIGSGPQVIIVPGRLFLRSDFGRLARPDRTFIFYDMRNRGESDRVDDVATLTVQQDVADLEQVRRHFGAERIDLIGYSYLGLMVAMYALDHPERVGRLVQLGPVPRDSTTRYPRELTAEDHPPAYPEADVERARLLRESGWALQHPREYCEIAWSINRFALVGDPGKVDQLGPGWCDMANEYPTNLRRHFEHHWRSVQQVDLAEQTVRALRQPVLTIHGTWDRNAPYGAGREWAATVADGRLLTVSGAAHHPWVEAPELVFPAIDEFLRGRWPPLAEIVGAR